LIIVDIYRRCCCSPFIAAISLMLFHVCCFRAASLLFATPAPPLIAPLLQRIILYIFVIFR